MSPLQLDSGSSSSANIIPIWKVLLRNPSIHCQEKEYLRHFVDIVDDNTDADIIVVHSKLRLMKPSCHAMSEL